MRAATHADAGIVVPHACKMCFATLHRTDETRSAAPTPMTLVATTWVVDTGMPAAVEPKRTAAEATCESKAWTGSSLKMRRPSVRMMGHPPPSVPAVMTSRTRTRTHTGTVDSEERPDATRFTTK